jgi:hypothetical protein
MRTSRIAMLGAGTALTVSLAITGWLGPAWGTTAAPARPPAMLSTASMSSPRTTLAADIAAARAATAKYSTNLAKAKTDGYFIITKMMPSMGYHFLNPNVSGFNVRKPPILVYEHVAGKWQLGALEWVFTSEPKNPPLPNATYGFFPAACHYADGTFIQDKTASTCPASAPGSHAKFTFWHPNLVTMHFWIWYPNPDGLYGSTNPLVTPYNKG